MSERVRTRPIIAVAVVAASVLAILLILELALRVEEAVRLDSALATRLAVPDPAAIGPDEIRIVAFGDSFTRGVYVEGARAFPGALERRLLEKGVAASVLNFGVPGSNTLDQLALAKQVIPDYVPDVVVVGFYANDIEKSRAERIAEAARGEPADSSPQKERFATRLLRWRDRSYLLRYLSPRVIQILGRTGIRIPGAVEYAPRLNAVFRENRPRFQVCQDALREMNDLATAADARFLVLIFPVMAPFGENYPLPDYHEAVASFCEMEGIACLDLLPPFHGENPLRLQVSLLDTHPNAAAYEIVAAALEKRLDASGWLRQER